MVAKLPKTVRVAAVQYAVGPDVDANLATTLRMIDQAAADHPDLLVLPEFVNHCSWYEDGAHCARVSIATDGPFVKAVAERAKRWSMYIVLNGSAVGENDECTGTSMLISPDGELLCTSDKQVLIGHENDFLQRATEPSPVVETPIGRLGLYACMDGVLNETPRGLALRGAQVLCNSLNSFAFDEASLHIPVRAAENKVFVIAANKVGPLIPEFLVAPVSEQINIPGHFLSGAGESQIVAPDGTVLAKAPTVGEAVIYADINPRDADDKSRPDGTDIFAARRPELYGPIGEAPFAVERTTGPGQIEASVYQPEGTDEAALEESLAAIKAAAEAGCGLLVLPELFWLDESLSTDPEKDAVRGAQWLTDASALLAGGDLYVATSLIEKSADGWAHNGLLIGPDGVCLRNPQLHPCNRHREWLNTGQTIAVAQLPIGRVAVITGDDNLFPESYRLATLKGAEIIAAPFTVSEDWELETGLPERAAENRVCVVAASRPGPAGASMLATLWSDFTIMTPWETRLFDGNISAPIVKRAARSSGLTTASIHPANAANKVLSHRTHVVDDRAWALAQPILAQYGG